MRSLPGSFTLPRGPGPFAWLAGAAAVFALSALTVGNVPVGYNGVEECMSRLTGRVTDSGWQIKPPWCTFRKLSIGNNQYVVDAASAVSRDQQSVKTSVDVTWTLNPASLVEIERKYHGELQEIVLAPNVQQALKQATSGYTNTELTTKRDEVARSMESILRDRLKPYNNDIQIVQLSLTNFTFEPGYMQSREDLAIASSKLMTEKTNLQTEQVRANEEVIRAEGARKAQELQRQTLTPELIQLEAIKVQRQMVDKWDGHMPQVMSGSGTMLGLQLPQPGTEPAK